MSTPFTIADDFDPDGDMSPNANPKTEYRAYLVDVRGGMVGDMGFTLDDFKTYIAGLRKPNWADRTRFLDLSKLGLTSLPESIGEMTLYLSGNRLPSVPESFDKVTSLEELDLSDNQLTSLPDGLGKLTKLKALYLSGNRLSNLPESLGKVTSMEELDLSDNQLTSLPDWLGKLTKLKALYLSGNRLTSLFIR
jgi:Leucine-rich repeat (LRR) protein